VFSSGAGPGSREENTTCQEIPADRPRIVLCAGIAVEDFLFQVDRFPEPGTKVNASLLVQTSGGCAANAAVAVARLGGAARFAGPIGTDDSSRRFAASLVRAKVDISGVEHIPGGSISTSGIFIDGTGEKMVATRRGDKLGDARPADPGALVADIDIMLVDNRLPNFVRPLCEAARSRDIPVVLDVDRVTQTDDPLLRLATHTVFSSEALQATTGIADPAMALRSLASGRDGFFAVTDGAGDILWMAGDEVRHLPVFTVRCVDTLGAGDVFHGAFALAIAEGRDPVSAMRFAAAAAALKCERFGGIAGAPTRRDTEDFLSRTTPS
jgi:sugar/nucleoside kinase (ribokinase family)